MKFSNKKGIASLTTFSLILLLLFSVFLLAYNYYVGSKEDAYILNNKIELLNSGVSLRSNLLELSKKPNSTLIYRNNLDSSNIVIILNNSHIYLYQDSASKRVQINLTNFGLDFCSEYEFLPSNTNNFLFNGTCISISTS